MGAKIDQGKRLTDLDKLMLGERTHSLLLQQMMQAWSKLTDL